MVYSDIHIKKALANGHIVISPLIEENVRGSSVDVTLGEWYYRTGGDGRDIYNPYDVEDVARYFGELKQAVAHTEWANTNGRKLLSGIPADHPIIVLAPGERVLAHTNEFIGINPPGTSEMRARSSMGRNGIAVCFDAGWGDPGYINRWTMEILNLNRTESVVLPVGERVAQIVFHETSDVERHYGHGGKYQAGANIDEIMREWHPSQMLPRSHQDVRRRLN